MANDDNLAGVGIALVILGSLGMNLGNNLMVLGHEQHRQIQQEIKDAEQASNREKYAVTEDIEEGKALEGGSAKQDETVDAPPPSKAGSVENTAQREKGPKEKKGTVWLPGALLFLVSSLAIFAAFNFAPASLVAALESVQFVSHLWFTKTVHNLPVTTRMKLGTAGIVAGCILTVVFSDKSTKVLNSDKVWTLYDETAFLVYLGFFAVFFIIFESIYRVYWAANRRGNRLANHDLFEPMAYCLSTSIVGAFAVVHAKCLAGLLQVTSTTDRNEFEYWKFYIILGAWLGFVVFWLTRLDLCFKQYPPWAVPVVHCCFIFFSIVAGGIFFKEFDGYSITQIIGFALGVIFIVGGVYGIAPTDRAGHGGAVVPVDEGGVSGKGGVKGEGTESLDDIRPRTELVLKPGYEKESAMNPGTPGDKSNELDAMMATTPSSSKRKIVKHDVSNIQDSL